MHNLLTISAFCLGASLAAQEFPNQIAAGEVQPRSALLWTRAAQPGLVIFQVDDEPTFQWPWRISFTWVSNPARPAKVRMHHLQADTRYHYRALRFGAVSDTGTFCTPATPGNHVGLKFGVSGDWRGELAPYPSVRNAGGDLDFFVGLGDTIYADYASPALPIPQAQTLGDFRTKHSEVYAERNGLNTLGDLRRQTAWFATIDDHEVINDFSGGAHPSTDPRFQPSNKAFINKTRLFKNGLKAFVDYNPLRSTKYRNTGDPRFDGRRKLYRTRRFGDDAAIFVLDNRSFRDEPLQPVANPSDPFEVQVFLIDAFDPTRTMLGQTQLQDLLDDLSAADAAGVTWKFVFVPEPIQNLGVVAASDRFEGYAAERTQILDHITQHGIDNVVFVAADLHGTLVNNLTYQMGPGQPQIPTNAFEIITGSVAYDAPFGPTLVSLAAQIGLLSPAEVAFYNSLPTPAKDGFLKTLIDNTITPLGYDTLGLDNSPINFALNAGGWLATHTFGWTEFDIDQQSQALTITTYGIEPYTELDLQINPQNVVNRVPQVVQQFVVQPQ